MTSSWPRARRRKPSSMTTAAACSTTRRTTGAVSGRAARPGAVLRAARGGRRGTGGRAPPPRGQGRTAATGAMPCRRAVRRPATATWTKSAAAGSPAGRATPPRPTGGCGCASSTTTWRSARSLRISTATTCSSTAHGRRTPRVPFQHPGRAVAAAAPCHPGAARGGRQDLPNSPWLLEATPLALTAPDGDRRQLPLRGQLDLATRERIAGWAQDAAAPETPVALQILDNGTPLARVLANLGRADLGGRRDRQRTARLRPHHPRRPVAASAPRHPGPARGGRCRAAGLAGGDRGGQRLRLRTCNRRSPARWRRSAPDDDRDRMLSFILEQADRLLQQRADAEAQRTERLAHRQFHRRWGPLVEAAAGAAGGPDARRTWRTPRGFGNDPVLRALVIDERLPVGRARCRLASASCRTCARCGASATR